MFKSRSSSSASSSSNEFIPETNIDAQLLEMRQRRMRWILQDAEDIVKTFSDRALKEAFLTCINQMQAKY